MGEKYNIEKLKKYGKALNNEYRLQILKECSEKEHNITELQKKINISYPHIHNHVHILKDADLVETYIKTNSKGKNVMVISKYIIKDGVLEKTKQ